MTQLLVTLYFIAVLIAHSTATNKTKKCLPTATKASGLLAPKKICSGDLIFSDDFSFFDFEKWQHENTLSGGWNSEFQLYSNNRSNSFTQNGKLHIRPSLLSDQLGEKALTSKTLNVDGGDPASRCTNPQWNGCEKTGKSSQILNPIKSARIRTEKAFRFVYGKVEVKAKISAGDWLRTAIRLLPSHNAYGTWPSSGEIDLVKIRGNRKLLRNKVNIGVERASCTLYFGPYPELNGWRKAHWTRNSPAKRGYNKGFHRYQMEWTPDFIRFSIDDKEIGRMKPSKSGFWELGRFGNGRKIDNPWKRGTKMSPFDEKFHLIIELAAGGDDFLLDDDYSNPEPKPWINNTTMAANTFWNARADWLPTWSLGVNDDADLQVDYVKIWAL